MDLFITGTPAQQSTGGLSPQAKFFEPLTPKGVNASANETLAFHLIVFDPASDSSLTPGWTVPVDPLVVQESVSISELISLLRDYLPVRRHRLGLSTVTGRGAGEKQAGGSGSGSSSNASSTRVVPPSSNNSSSHSSSSGNIRPSPSGALFGRLRRPKVEYAHVFLARSPDGEVVPLCRDDADWHFKNAYVRVDLTSKSEMEWRLFKELIVAARGQFKCYLAVKGQGSRSPFHW